MLRWILAFAMQPAAADGSASIELHWDAPPGCPTQAEMLQRIAALGPDAGRTVRVAVVHEGTRFRARVEIDGDARSLDAASCEAIAQAVALVAAIGGTAASPPDEARIPAAPESTTPPATHPRATTSPPPPARAPARAPAPRRRTGLRVALGVDAGITWRTVPGVAPTLGGGVAILGRAWRVDVRAHGTTRTSATLDAPADDVTVDVRSALGSVRGAWVPRVRIVELPLGGGLELGAHRGHARGGVNPRRRTALFAALVASAGVAVVPLPWLAIRAELVGVLALARPRFGVQTPDGDRLVETPWVGLLALGGLEFRIPTDRRGRR